MTERFEKTLAMLQKAYFDGALKKGSCHTCAVGNIISGYNRSGSASYWTSAFVTDSSNVQWRYEKYYPLLQEFLNKNGIPYTVEELARIEYAFETNTKIYYTDYQYYSEQEILEDQFNGLSAVVDVLAELDKVDNLEKKYNASFRKHPKLIQTI